MLLLRILVWALSVMSIQSTSDLLKTPLWTQLITNNSVLVIDNCEGYCDADLYNNNAIFSYTVMKFTRPGHANLFTMKTAIFDVVLVLSDSDYGYKVSPY